MKILALLLPLFLLAACDGDTANRRAARGETFVPDPNHVYFMNVRLRDYTDVDLEEGIVAYYLNDLTDAQAAVQPVIVDEWLKQHASLRFNRRGAGGEYDELFDGTIEVEHKEYGWMPVYTNQRAGLQELNNHLSSGRPLRIRVGDEVKNAFPDPADRTEVYEVIRDYLALTGK